MKLIAIRNSDNKQFVVWKYLNRKGLTSVWCEGWEGRHIVGQDCDLEMEGNTKLKEYEEVGNDNPLFDKLMEREDFKQHMKWLKQERGLGKL